MCNLKQVARWASVAGIAILTLSVADMGFAADPERPYGGCCATVITPLTPPGVFPQELSIDYDCTLNHLGRTTAIAMQVVTPISQSGVIVTAGSRMPRRIPQQMETRSMSRSRALR